MGRRREETVDEELLARLEQGGSDKIRVPLPSERINEMFAIADQILGGRKVRVVCADGESRLARIPGKMRRRQWVREGDLIIVQPWDFQDAKADVKRRYTKTQSLYLSRKGVLPEIVDIFGSGKESWDDYDDAGIFGDSSDEAGDEAEESASESASESAAESDEVVDEDSSEDATKSSEQDAGAAAQEAANESLPEPATAVVDDDDIDSLFGPA